MLSLFKKKIPSGDTKEVTVVKSWVVSWKSRYGDYSAQTTKEYEVFTSEQDAEDYKDQLKAAFKILRFTDGTNVSVKVNDK